VSSAWRHPREIELGIVEQREPGRGQAGQVALSCMSPGRRPHLCPRFAPGDRAEDPPAQSNVGEATAIGQLPELQHRGTAGSKRCGGGTAVGQLPEWQHRGAASPKRRGGGTVVGQLPDRGSIWEVANRVSSPVFSIGIWSF
jgi:hypothetical protein